MEAGWGGKFGCFKVTRWSFGRSEAQKLQMLEDNFAFQMTIVVAYQVICMLFNRLCMLETWDYHMIRPTIYCMTGFNIEGGFVCMLVALIMEVILRWFIVLLCIARKKCFFYLCHQR